MIRDIEKNDIPSKKDLTENGYSIFIGEDLTHDPIVPCFDREDCCFALNFKPSQGRVDIFGNRPKFCMVEVGSSYEEYN